MQDQSKGKTNFVALFGASPIWGGVRRRERASARAATGADAQGGGSIGVGRMIMAFYVRAEQSLPTKLFGSRT
jgi:hypothetical protein